MIKLVAFDWNGTLLADTALCVYADNKALEAVGQAPITVRRMQQTFDIPIIKFWENLGFGKQFFLDNAETIRNVFYAAYEAKVSTLRSRSGSATVLQWLGQKHIPAVIFSNHTKSDIEKQLHRLKLDKYITDTLAREDDDITHLHTRSKEKKLQEYIQTWGFAAHEVLCIGDTCEEVEIAKKLGIYSVALTGGQSTRSRLMSHKPDFLINSLGALEGIIKTINNKKSH